MKWIAKIGLLGMVFSMLVVAGCQTTPDADKHAVACPGCKNVKMLAYHPNAEISGQAANQVHKCEGCQGELGNLLKNGKWEHTCSICKDQPYHCMVEGS